VKTAAWFGALGMMLVAFSCDPELSLEEALEGKRCRGDSQECLVGYECNAEGFCVRPILSEGGSSSMNPPPADPGGAGGSAGVGMDTMNSDVPDATDAAPGCTRVLSFLDRDGDGFGSDAPADQEVRCLSAGWVSRGGDCFDAERTPDNRAEQVHKEQTTYFPEGYPIPGQPGQISFDYDCSGAEEADLANDATKRAGDCASTSPANCGPAGGIQTTDRLGEGVDDRCGSSTLLACNQLSAEECSPVPQPIDVFRCR
jgi:hypothetical protein